MTLRQRKVLQEACELMRYYDRSGAWQTGEMIPLMQAVRAMEEPDPDQVYHLTEWGRTDWELARYVRYLLNKDAVTVTITWEALLDLDPEKIAKEAKAELIQTDGGVHFTEQLYPE